MVRPSPADPQVPRSAVRDDPVALRMLVLLGRGQDIRAAKVRRVRSAIRAGTYENGLKLHIAVQRLAQDLSD